MGWLSADDRHEGYIEYVFADGWSGSGWDADGVTVTMSPDGPGDPVRRHAAVAAAIGHRRVAGGL
jgi:hypothetical protein